MSDEKLSHTNSGSNFTIFQIQLQNFANFTNQKRYFLLIFKSLKQKLSLFYYFGSRKRFLLILQTKSNILLILKT